MKSVIDEVLAHHIPMGWGVERISGKEALVLIAPASRVMVTIDFDRRGYRLGYVCTGPLATNTSYVGRGWAQKLVHDAAAAIIGIRGVDA